MPILRVGVISDTHGLLRPEALRALEGCARILHAGDVGSPEILEALERLAPVTAVRGNTDREAWAMRLRAEEAAEIAGKVWYIRHDLEGLALDPANADIRVVVYGHTHAPSVEVRGTVLFLNPGSAGPQRHGRPVSLAVVDVEGEDVRPRLLSLA